MVGTRIWPSRHWALERGHGAGRKRKTGGGAADDHQRRLHDIQPRDPARCTLTFTAEAPRAARRQYRPTPENANRDHRDHVMTRRREGTARHESLIKSIRPVAITLTRRYDHEDEECAPTVVNPTSCRRRASSPDAITVPLADGD